MLHSFVSGLVFYAWSKHLGLPSGRARRQILGLLLVLPLATAIVPGRAGFGFREGPAWVDSARILFLPLGGPLRVHHLVLGVCVASALATVWQELVPLIRRPIASAEAVPVDLLRRVRSMPGWARCEVGLAERGGIFFATAGWPWRPTLSVSRAALRDLSETELESTLFHENAHWRRRRWWALHVLFLARLLQFYNPVALWIFREYSLEVEVDCDAEAVRGRDPRPLALALVKVYESADRTDFSSRMALRRRVDILLGRRPRADDGLHRAAVAAAGLLLLLLLPWIV